MRIIFFVAVMLTSTAVFAHVGHGPESSNWLAHHLLAPGHVIPLAIICIVAVGTLVARKKLATKRIKK